MVIAAARTELELIRSACVEVAREIDPTRSPALEGFCVETSIVVHGIFGGCLRFGVVDGNDHFWNELPDGTEVDLTSDQFDGDGFTPVAFGVEIAIPSPAPLKAIAFAQRVSDLLVDRSF